MRPVVETILRRPVAVAMAYLAILVLGIVFSIRIPIELSPHVEFPRFTVVTIWPGASPETVEASLTAPIEEIASTVEGVQDVYSSSREGFSSVTVEFQRNVEIDFARIELNEKLTSLIEALPYDVVPPRIQPYIPKDFRELQGFLSYTVAGDLPLPEIRRIVEEELKAPLLAVEGVSNVEVLGGTPREIQILLDNERLQASGLSFQDVTKAFRPGEVSTSAGSIIEGSQRVTLRLENELVSLTDFEQTILKVNVVGVPIRLSDVGNVVDRYQDPRSYYRINGKPAVTLRLDKEPGFHTIRVADAVEGRLRELRHELPPELVITKEIDKSETMRKDFSTLTDRAALSIVFVAFVLFVFLQKVRASLIVMFSILFSVLLTIIFFTVAGLTLNVMTLAALALAFGIVTDNSIIVFENIARWSHVEASRESLIPKAVDEMFLPVVASTLTTVGAMVPVFFLPYHLLLYFAQFVIALGVSLLASLFVAFSLIPLLSYHSPKPRSLSEMDPFSGTERKRVFSDKLIKLYRPVLRWLLGHRKGTVVIAVWFFGVPVWLLPQKIETPILAALYNPTFGSQLYQQTVKPYVDHVLGGSLHLFFRYVHRGEVWRWGEETYLVLAVYMPTGTELDRTNDVMKELEQEVRRYSNTLERFVTNVASNEEAQMTVTFRPEVAHTGFPYQLKAHLTAYAAQIGGASVGVYGFGPGFFSGGQAAPTFHVKILGYNYRSTRQVAEILREELMRNPRIDEVDIDRSLWGGGDLFEVTARVDRKAIARYGFQVSDVIRELRSLTRGAVERSVMRLGIEEVNYSVKFTGFRDFSIDALQSRILRNAQGESVRLGDIIQLGEQRVLSDIVRENQQYQRYVTFEYKGPYKYGNRFVESVIKKVNAVIPAGYTVQKSEWIFFSEEEEMELAFMIVIAICVVFMVTASLYESFRKPFLIILAVPLSAIGLFLAFYLTGATFDRGGFASLLLLTGIAVNSSIILVDHLSRSNATSIDEIVEASSHRLRPILMTSLTTIAALLPLVLEESETAFWHSLGIGAIGGLISSTILVLFVVPALYVSLARKPSSEA